MRHLKQPKGFYTSAFMLMLPMILQNFISNFMALADTFMVGILGETELAAITMANSIFFVLGLMVFGVMSGTSVLVAQYNGRGDHGAINRIMGAGFYVSVSLTALVAITCSLFPETVMGIITNNESLIAPGAEYMRIVGFSYVFMSISGVYIAVMRSMENTSLGAWVYGFSGVLNIFLNYALIFGKFGLPAFGCSGAAIATLISRFTEVLIVIAYSNRSKVLKLEPALIIRPGMLIAKDFAKFSIPVLLNEGLWSLAISLYTIIIGHMPDSTPILAGYTIAGNIDKLAAVALFAAGNAAAVIIGRNIGRGDDMEEVYSTAVALNFICVLTGVLSSCVLLFVRYYVCDAFIFPLMGISSEAGVIAKYILFLIALIMPLRSFNLCNIVGVFRGGGDVRFGLLCDITPLYLVCVPAAALCGLVFMYGIEVVYLCVILDEFLKFFLCLFRFRSKKWINNITRELST